MGMPNSDSITSPQEPGAADAHLTIGLFIPNTVEAWELPQWQATIDAARAYHVRLICFPGGGLRSPHGFETQANVIYHLVNTARLAGLIFWGGNLLGYVDKEVIAQFCQRYFPRPIISVENIIEGIPRILGNDYLAMRAGIVHLLDVHGYRRLAFIRGHAGHFGLQERYRAYRRP
jgi:DNA-binding LacI/PurR family transcriptional regulator